MFQQFWKFHPQQWLKSEKRLYEIFLLFLTIRSASKSFSTIYVSIYLICSWVATGGQWIDKLKFMLQLQDSKNEQLSQNTSQFYIFLKMYHISSNLPLTLSPKIDNTSINTDAVNIFAYFIPISYSSVCPKFLKSCYSLATFASCLLKLKAF